MFKILMAVWWSLAAVIFLLILNDSRNEKQCEAYSELNAVSTKFISGACFVKSATSGKWWVMK